MALSRQNRELESAKRELGERARELARSNADLEQFAYVASHDLKEPLRTVSSYVTLLANRYKDRLDAEANDFIEFAVQGVNRMQRLIQDVLAYSRVGGTREFQPVDCTQVLENAIARLRSAIQDCGAVVAPPQPQQNPGTRHKRAARAQRQAQHRNPSRHHEHSPNNSAALAAGCRCHMGLEAVEKC